MKKKVLLCVTGSVFAYKSADIAVGLISKGYDVFVIMTNSAAKFISPVVFESITKNKVYDDLFEGNVYNNRTYVSFAQESDLILVAPATYNIIGKAAYGIADNLVSSVLAVASAKKVMYAPSMSAGMYNNPALASNLNTLARRGSVIIEPDEPTTESILFENRSIKSAELIVEAAEGFFCKKMLKDKKVVVTAGAARIYLDSVRYLSNTATGLMGVSIAKACRNMGARVTLISANSQYKADGVETINVCSTEQLFKTSILEFKDADMFIFTASPGCYVSSPENHERIRKAGDKIVIELQKSRDILFELGKLKTRQLFIGFSAKSENLIDYAREMLEYDNLDIVVANGIQAFSSNEAEVYLITKQKVTAIQNQPKETLAYEIIRRIIEDIHA